MGLRRALAVAAAAYALGAAVGYAVPWFDLATRAVGGVELSSWSVFTHNLRAALIVYLASTVYLGVALVALNGYVLGTAVALGLSAGLTGLQVAAALLPHGIVEVPAFLLASALGLETRGYLKRLGAVGAFRIAAGLAGVAGLLAAAAYIEVNVTPKVLEAAGVKMPG